MWLVSGQILWTLLDLSFAWWNPWIYESIVGQTTASLQLCNLMLQSHKNQFVKITLSDCNYVCFGCVVFSSRFSFTGCSGIRTSGNISSRSSHARRCQRTRYVTNIKPLAQLSHFQFHIPPISDGCWCERSNQMTTTTKQHILIMDSAHSVCFRNSVFSLYVCDIYHCVFLNRF